MMTINPKQVNQFNLHYFPEISGKTGISKSTAKSKKPAFQPIKFTDNTTRDINSISLENDDKKNSQLSEASQCEAAFEKGYADSLNAEHKSSADDQNEDLSTALKHYLDHQEQMNQYNIALEDEINAKSKDLSILIAEKILSGSLTITDKERVEQIDHQTRFEPKIKDTDTRLSSADTETIKAFVKQSGDFDMDAMDGLF